MIRFKCTICGETFESVELIQNHSLQEHNQVLRTVDIVHVQETGSASPQKTVGGSSETESKAEEKVDHNEKGDEGTPQNVDNSLSITPSPLEQGEAGAAASSENTSEETAQSTEDDALDFGKGERLISCKRKRSIIGNSGRLKRLTRASTRINTFANPTNKKSQHSSRRRFQCPHCPIKFPCNAALIIHIRVHTGERPFECKVCKRRFKRKEHVKYHHTNLHGGRGVQFVEIKEANPDPILLENPPEEENSDQPNLPRVATTKPREVTRTSKRIGQRMASRNRGLLLRSCRRPPVNVDQKKSSLKKKTGLSKPISKHATATSSSTVNMGMSTGKLDATKRSKPERKVATTPRKSVVLAKSRLRKNPHKCAHCGKLFPEHRDLLIHTKSHGRTCAEENPFQRKLSDIRFKRKAYTQIHSMVKHAGRGEQLEKNTDELARLLPTMATIAQKVVGETPKIVPVLGQSSLPHMKPASPEVTRILDTTGNCNKPSPQVTPQEAPTKTSKTETVKLNFKRPRISSPKMGQNKRPSTGGRHEIQQLKCSHCPKIFRRRFHLNDHCRTEHGGDNQPEGSKDDKKSNVATVQKLRNNQDCPVPSEPKVVVRTTRRTQKIIDESNRLHYRTRSRKSEGVVNQKKILSLRTRGSLGKLRHPCSHCGRSFRFASLLTKHIMIHTGLRPYQCKICGRTFTQKNSVRKHCVGKHGASRSQFRVIQNSPRKRTMSEESIQLLELKHNISKCQVHLTRCDDPAPPKDNQNLQTLRSGRRIQPRSDSTKATMRKKKSISNIPNASSKCGICGKYSTRFHHLHKHSHAGKKSHGPPKNPASARETPRRKVSRHFRLGPVPKIHKSTQQQVNANTLEKLSTSEPSFTEDTKDSQPESVNTENDGDQVDNNGDQEGGVSSSSSSSTDADLGSIPNQDNCQDEDSPEMMSVDVDNTATTLVPEHLPQTVDPQVESGDPSAPPQTGENAEESEIKCPHCEKTFLRMWALKRHLTRYHQDKSRTDETETESQDCPEPEARSDQITSENNDEESSEISGDSGSEVRTTSPPTSPIPGTSAKHFEDTDELEKEDTPANEVSTRKPLIRPPKLRIYDFNASSQLSPDDDGTSSSSISGSGEPEEDGSNQEDCQDVPIMEDQTSTEGGSSEKPEATVEVSEVYIPEERTVEDKQESGIILEECGTSVCLEEEVASASSSSVKTKYTFRCPICQESFQDVAPLDQHYGSFHANQQILFALEREQVSSKETTRCVNHDDTDKTHSGNSKKVSTESSSSRKNETNEDCVLNEIQLPAAAEQHLCTFCSNGFADTATLFRHLREHVRENLGSSVAAVDSEALSAEPRKDLGENDSTEEDKQAPIYQKSPASLPLEDHAQQESEDEPNPENTTDIPTPITKSLSAAVLPQNLSSEAEASNTTIATRKGRRAARKTEKGLGNLQKMEHDNNGTPASFSSHKCDECQKIYTYPRSLAKHKIQVHSRKETGSGIAGEVIDVSAQNIDTNKTTVIPENEDAGPSLSSAST